MNSKRNFIAKNNFVQLKVFFVFFFRLSSIVLFSRSITAAKLKVFKNAGLISKFAYGPLITKMFNL